MASTGRERPCPWWCTTDHSQRGYHAGDVSGIREVLVRAIDSDGNPTVLILTNLSPGGPALWLPPAEAETLADLIGVLDALPPADRREVADAIRRAAGTITRKQENP